MTEQEGEHHLRDLLFHGLGSNIHNALHYMYGKPARKAEMETPGSGASEVRAKSAVVELETQPKTTRSESAYEAIMQQIAYLMSAINNQNVCNNGLNVARHNNWNGKFHNTKMQRSKKDQKDMLCWGCGGTGHGWRECSTPR